MFVDCRCVRCHRPLRVLERHRGRALRCPGCAAVVVVPSSSDTRRPVVAAEPMPSRPSPNSPLLPWMLLTPAALCLALWLGTGRAVLWAQLGVGLGGLCLLLGQRARWPLSLRIGASLSSALLGHGLTLASPLKALPAPRAPTPQVEASASLPVPAPRFVPSTGETANISHSSEVEDLMLRGLRREEANRPASVDLKPVAQLGDLLTAAVAAAADGNGVVLTAARDGAINDFSYPDFCFRGSHPLDGVAYRLALDERRGVLWAAVCAAGNLRANRHGDQPLGRADLHVYDVPRSANSPLRPRRVLPLGGDVLELIVMPDQSAVFYLVRTEKGVRLGRLDAARQTLDRRIVLPDETQALCLTPDGQALYAAGGGRVYLLDPRTLRTRQRLDVPLDAYAVAADNDGCVYLAERGQWTNLTCLDLRRSPAGLRQWSARLHGRIYMKMSPDQYRLYVCSSSLISDALESMLLRGHPWSTPLLTAMTVSTAQHPVQGEFFLTPDGRFLINRWGSVFHLARGAPTIRFTNRGAIVKKQSE
jgi:hypothetical protein